MAKKLYETLFLLDPTKVSADAEGVKQQLHALIERHGGHIEISRPWDYNHKLAYPINKQKKGSYHIIYYTLESTKQGELERDFAIQEGVVLRQLTTRIHPKWQEEILRIAREDPSNAFALRGMIDESAVPTDPMALADGLGDEGLATTAAPRESSGRRRRETAEKPE